MLLAFLLPAQADMLPLLDRSVFSRTDFIYGSEIGAWDTDGGTAITLPACRHKIKDAGIRVIRFGNWTKLDTREAVTRFSHAIDGMRAVGAYPIIKLPPIWDKQCNGAPNAWNLEWLKNIIQVAGSRVQLYEFANEPDNYCKWDGITYARYWEQTVPQLKAYARSLGFEIYIGGPALANSYPEDIGWIKNFLDSVKLAYQQSGNRDYIPDFISTHTYLTEQQNASVAAMQSAVNGWGIFYDNLHRVIDQTFAGVNDPAGIPLASQIRIADSEYNFTINQANDQQYSPTFTEAYVKSMFTMFRERHIWMANLFTLQSHRGQALDMFTEACTAKPLYDAYRSLQSPTSPRMQR
ncbi:MAG TPA: hypothetical protein VFT64_05725 [Rickettsiales bacterium]|nr:hypothetical protein [Rickettsiales bacterium]